MNLLTRRSILHTLPMLAAGLAALPARAGGISLLHNAASAQVNATLTTYGQGIAMDLASKSLASWFAPFVLTGRGAGQYKRYGDKEAFALYRTLMAGANRTRVAFAADDPWFNCLPHGLEIDTAAFEQQLAGVAGSGGPSIDVRKQKVRTMINAAFRSREKFLFDTIKTGKAATGSIGNWVSDAVDPVSEIDGEILAIATDTGLMPNRMIIPVTVWARIKNHPLVKARLTGVTHEGLTLSAFAGMLLNPAIEIRIGLMPYDTAPRGKTASKSNVYGPDVWIWYGEDSPDTMDPSFAKVFSTTGMGVDNVQSYIEKGNVDVDFVEWSEAPVVTAPASGRRITVTLA